MKKNTKIKIAIFNTSLFLTGSIILTGFLGTGALKDAKKLNTLVKYYEFNIKPINEIEKIDFNDNRIHFSNEYTKDDLMHASKVTINLLDDKDYSFINEMPNLEELIINDYSKDNNLDEIDGINFQNQINIIINKMDMQSSFTENKFLFLKDIPYINSLELNNSPNIESRFLESLTNVHNLTLDVDKYFCMNFKDLYFLESLYIKGKPYNISMFLSKDDLFLLSEAGVKFETDDIESLTKITSKIDNIVRNLKIDKNDTDSNKVDKVITYVINNSDYSEEVKNNISDLSKVDFNQFYGGGYLTGFLINNSQICGNYTAAVTSILHSLDIECYNMFSNNHCWNIIKLDGEFYYFDPTLLDSTTVNLLLSKEDNIVLTSEEIFNNQEYSYLKEYFSWYKVNPKEKNKSEDGAHIPVFIPADVALENKELLQTVMINTLIKPANITDAIRNLKGKLLKEIIGINISCIMIMSSYGLLAFLLSKSHEEKVKKLEMDEN